MRLTIFLIFFLFIGCATKSKDRVIIKPLKRVALVIGNKDYRILKKLENPINDAKAVKKVLEDLGFDTTLAINVGYKNFNELLKKFKLKIDNNTMVFFYFAGHANTLQRNSSEEFLAMIEEDNNLSLVSLYRLYETFIKSNARYNIVAIDACRNYQENDKEVLLSRGTNLRDVVFDEGSVLKSNVLLDNHYTSDFPPSTLISYATMHNQKAYDRGVNDPSHSPYAKALINHLADEEIPIEVVFKRVRSDLIKELKGKQINLEESSLEKNIWLQPKRGNVSLSVAF